MSIKCNVMQLSKENGDAVPVYPYKKSVKKMGRRGNARLQFFIHTHDS